jgi:hypothetical protein
VQLLAAGASPAPLTPLTPSQGLHVWIWWTSRPGGAPRRAVREHPDLFTAGRRRHPSSVAPPATTALR